MTTTHRNPNKIATTFFSLHSWSNFSLNLFLIIVLLWCLCQILICFSFSVRRNNIGFCQIVLLVVINHNSVAQILYCIFININIIWQCWVTTKCPVFEKWCQMVLEYLDLKDNRKWDKCVQCFWWSIQQRTNVWCWIKETTTVINCTTIVLKNVKAIRLHWHLLSSSYLFK